MPKIRNVWSTFHPIHSPRRKGNPNLSSPYAPFRDGMANMYEHTQTHTQTGGVIRGYCDVGLLVPCSFTGVSAVLLLSLPSAR